MHRPLLPVIGTAIAEGIACFLIVVIALPIASTTGFPAIVTGVGYGLAVIAMTSVFRSNTGAMFGPGQAVIRFLSYMIGLEKRKYDPLGSRAMKQHAEKHHFLLFMHWHNWWHAAVDFAGLVLVLGCQLGGSLLGALFVKHFVHTVDVAGIVHVSPFDNLATRNRQSFGFIWGLLSFLFLTYVSVTMHRYKLNWAKKKLHSAIQNPSLAYGAATAAVAWASYQFGAGTTGNFTIDLALGIVFGKDLTHVWVSLVGTLLATITVFLVYLALRTMDWLRQRINKDAKEHPEQHGVALLPVTKTGLLSGFEEEQH
jgi:hypothetical protein